MGKVRVVVSIVAVGLIACGGEEQGLDAGMRRDSGRRVADAGSDAGRRMLDAGRLNDAGRGEDAGSSPDAGPDAGPATVTVTAENSGNATSGARHTITCEATGQQCTAEGNRAGYAPCSIECPVLSTITHCCSNGPDPCGGSNGMSDERWIEGYSTTGFVTTDCADALSSRLAYSCSSALGTADATARCAFTD